MIQKTSGYVYGTAAKKIEYDVYEENSVLKKKKTYKRNNKAKFRFVLLILFGFALSFVIMFRYAVITELNYKIAKVNKTYSEIKNENVRMKVEIDKQMDISKIREAAEKKLGMQKPDKYQIVYVNVPKNDFTKVADAKIESYTSNGNPFSDILDRVVRFSGLLY